MTMMMMMTTTTTTTDKSRTRLLRHPLLHFLLLGGLLFAADALQLGGLGQDERTPLEMPARRLAALIDDWTLTVGRPPTQRELEALAMRALDEELLYREALRLGLDRGDQVIRARLIRNMRFLEGKRKAGEEELLKRAFELGLQRSDQVVRRYLVEQMKLVARSQDQPQFFQESELLEYLALHRERFKQAARVRLSHVFFDDRGDCDRVQARSRAVLDLLRRGQVSADQATRQGDPFPAGHHGPARTRREWEKTFGPEFAGRVMGLEEGRWHGPVSSVHGCHLVRIHERSDARDASLEEVRQQVLQGLGQRRRQERLQEFLEELRSRYALRM